MKRTQANHNLPASGSEDPADFEARAQESDRPSLRLWLRMLSCTTLVQRQVRLRLRTNFDITLPRFELMAHLDGAPDGLRMGEISRRMMVTGGNITGITDQLAAEGLVAREYSPDDRRAFILRLTAEGKRSFRRMAQTYEQEIETLLGQMPERDRETMHRLLGDLKQRVLDLSED